jgi:ubiquinone/menaquinone biosynthesis C-methylase UbiE
VTGTNIVKSFAGELVRSPRGRSANGLRPESWRPAKIVLWRRRVDNPTLRYDEVARRRVTVLACRRGGPALEVGTGPCAPMARRLARCGMRVTAVDRDAKAVGFAERAAAAPELKGRLNVRQGNGGRLPFEDASYRVVVAFDCLGHARAPERILAEMFRVRSRDGIVLITEYNKAGREATRHRNFGFEDRLAGLLQAHCAGCRRVEHPHHITYVCDARTRRRRSSPGPVRRGRMKEQINERER